MNRQDLYQLLSKIEISYKTLLEEPSLNGLSPNLYMQNRIVLEIENRIYRVATPREIKQRILTQEWLNSLGINIMLADKWESSLSGKIFGVSSQEKIEISPSKSNLLLKKFFEENQKCEELFKKYGIIWFNNNNSGIDKYGDVKIIDWAANLTVSQNRLIDKQGQILWSKNFEEEL